MQKVLEAIKTKLDALSLATTGNFLNEAPQDQTEPYLVYNVGATLPTRGFGGVEGQALAVEIELIDLKASGSKTIGDINDAIFTGLQGVTFAASGLDRVTMTNDNRGFETIEEDAVIISSLWSATAFLIP